MGCLQRWCPVLAAATLAVVLTASISHLAQAQSYAEWATPAQRETALASEVPPRDPRRLKGLPVAALDDDALRAHVQGLQPRIARALAPQARQRLDALDKALAREFEPGPERAMRLRDASHAAALLGAWPDATALAARAAAASADAQDLGNLAAFLIIQGVPEAALPILVTLDARYPGDATLLNNLGQAWFALGETERAERALGAGVARAPRHPQAQATRSHLLAARGDRAGAAAAMQQALDGGFSTGKLARLEELGGRFAPKALFATLHMPQDPLGLHRLQRPAYPRDLGALLELKPAWEAFSVELISTGTERGLAAQQGLEAVLGRPPSANQASLAKLARYTFPLAAKVEAVKPFNDEQLERELGRAQDASQQARQELMQAELDVGTQVAQVTAECGAKRNFGGPQCGCARINKLVNQHLMAWNTRLEPLDAEWLTWSRREADQRAYVAQYSEADEVFVHSKARLKAGYWVTAGQATPAFEPPGVSLGLLASCVGAAEPARPRPGKLADYDELNCQHVYQVDLIAIGSIHVRCNRIEARLEPLMAPFKVHWAEDLRTDRLLAASVEIGYGVAKGVKAVASGHVEFDPQGQARSGGVAVGVKAKLGRPGKGPLAVGAGGGISVGAEFDGQGHTDVHTGATGQIGNAPPASWNWSAGASAPGPGSFDPRTF